MYRFEVSSQQRTEFVEITRELADVVTKAEFTSGALLVYVPHTTAGITINENADPDVVRDMLAEINRMVPFESDYQHAEGNSAAHIKASLVGSSCHLVVENGTLQLGTWQGVYLCEFDGPRRRSVMVQFLAPWQPRP